MFDRVLLAPEEPIVYRIIGLFFFIEEYSIMCILLKNCTKIYLEKASISRFLRRTSTEFPLGKALAG